MADGTNIGWTDATWNFVTGCKIKSPGCRGCYAMALAGGRLGNHPSRAGLTMQTDVGSVWNGEVRFNDAWLDQPLRWRRPRRIFVVAHGDLFYSRVPDHWIDSGWAIMESAHQHLYQVLTKRPQRAAAYLAGRAPRPHIWIGCSVERQQEADERRPALAALAAAGWNTWVSYEPAIGPVDWSGWEFVKWIVSGGESDMDGKSARPTHPGWHRQTRDWCARNRVMFDFKQWGSHNPSADHKPEECESDAPEAVHIDGRRERRPSECVRLVVCRAPGWAGMCRMSKKASGCVLDGREHHEGPAAGS